jgi:CRP-like cAMP-binding protein
VPHDHDARPSAEPAAAGIGPGETRQLPTIRAPSRPTNRAGLDEGTGWAPERMPARIPLLKSDPDLAEAVPPQDRLRARNALSALRLGFDPGPIDLAAERFPDATFALLIIRGALTQEVDLSDRAMIELLLAGDVLLPWPPSPTAPETQMRVTALESVQVAVLDQAYIKAAAVWPQLLIVLQRRLNDQKHRLAAHGAICQLPRVEQRVMAIMWHLAGRTGTVSPDGTELPRPLTHDNLAYLTGSRRPTVSLAIKRLRDLGYLDRRVDGTWLLPNVPGNAVFEDVIANLSEV